MRDPLVPLTEDQTRARYDLGRAIQVGEIKLTTVECVCGSKSAEVLADHERFGFPLITALCSQCGTVFSANGVNADTSPVFYERFYRRLHPGAGDKWRRAMKDAQKASHLDECCLPDAPIGEVGAGTGATAETLGEALGVASHAVDFDPAGENVRRGDWKALPDELGTLLAVHVLEHVLDPVQTLRQWASKVRFGGRLIVVVPDFLNVGSHRYVQDHGIKAWFHLAHVWNWTKDTVRLPFLLAGLRVVSVCKRGPGTLATVGSLVVVAERRDTGREMVDYVS